MLCGFENVGLVRKICVEKKEGNHSCAKIEILVTDEGIISDLEKKIGNEIQIEDERQIYFVGRISVISGMVTFQKTTLLVEAVSNSIKIDENPEFRVFQASDKTYCQVFEKVSNKNLIVQITDKDLTDKKISTVILQNKETDFAFINRIAYEQGFRVFVNDTNRKKEVITISKHKEGAAKEIDVADIIEADFMVEKDHAIVNFRTEKYFELGDRVRLAGVEYVILYVCIIEKSGEVNFYYRMSNKINIEICAVQDKMQIASLGKAKIISNTDPEHLGRLQVELLDVEDCLTGERAWIAYTPNFTEQSGGVLFYPEPGELVDIIYQNGAMTAIGCIRETAVKEEDLVKDKIIKINGKTIILNQEKIVVNNDTITVEIKESALKICCNDIGLNIEKDTIELDAKHMVISGSDKVIIKTNALDIV